MQFAVIIVSCWTKTKNCFFFYLVSNMLAFSRPVWFFPYIYIYIMSSGTIACRLCIQTCGLETIQISQSEDTILMLNVSLVGTYETTETSLSEDIILILYFFLVGAQPAKHICWATFPSCS